MPARDRERIIRTLDEMKTDPLAGDITALRGAYRGLYRRRVGSWRIIFGLKPEKRVVLIGDIVRRLRQLIEIAVRSPPDPDPICTDGRAGGVRRETRASHALAVLIEVDDGPDRIDFGGSIRLAIAAEDGAESRRSRIYGGRDWVRLGAVKLGLDCLRRYLQGLPVTERTDFERV
jgi:nicotinamide-nucleotide amidase